MFGAAWKVCFEASSIGARLHDFTGAEEGGPLAGFRSRVEVGPWQGFAPSMPVLGIPFFFEVA